MLRWHVRAFAWTGEGTGGVLKRGDGWRRTARLLTASQHASDGVYGDAHIEVGGSSSSAFCCRWVNCGLLVAHGEAAQPKVRAFPAVRTAELKSTSIE